ncbi:hypothetical protein ACH2GS_000370 [Acinetobacter baumannii]|nr:hypothetical protein [Acinetobacter baumannii]EKW1221730.1 hypothetical protein [Acinetobacter baumannii]ELB0337794.1 hypothetical protein [Acinetobacter baumannii]ELN4151841.1 hypothetical protein [Acinetobacter baumannii]
MNNYKIFLFGRNDKSQAIDLFLQLGYSLATRRESYLHPLVTALYAHSDGNIYTSADEPEIHTSIILSQLKDLVVLHRNDVNDANWETEGGDQIFKDSNDKSYIYRSDGWDELQRHEMRQAMWEKPLLPKAQPSNAPTEYSTIKVEGLEGLVDGKAALTAALAGETVQISVEPWEEKNWDTFNPLEDDVSTKVFFSGMSEGVQKVFFRIKPKTILINGVEVPAPFKPKHSDIGFILDNAKDCYRESQYVGQHIPFGWWRNEEEIKQVVAALRKVFEVQP